MREPCKDGKDKRYCKLFLIEPVDKIKEEDEYVQLRMFHLVIQQSPMSVKLSELINDATNDIHCTPTDTEMQTIACAVDTVEGAAVALRLQMEDRMDSYNKKKISQTEMMNCLELTNYVVQSSAIFRTQVAELSFLAHLQQIGKMKKKHTEVNAVEEKVRELIAVWGVYFPNELSEYAVLYRKYCAAKIINPLTQPTILLPTSITKLIPHVEHTLRNISRVLETGVGNMEDIYRHGAKINRFVVHSGLDGD